MKKLFQILFFLTLGLVISGSLLASDDKDHKEGESTSEEAYDPAETIMHHISDANEFHIFGNLSLPLPCILYAPEKGWSFFLSSAFDHGHTAVDGYVLNHGRVNRIKDASFPEGEVHLEGEIHGQTIHYHGKDYELDKPSTLDGGMLGGGITSFYDFSITKNVFTMIFAAILLILLFSAVAKGYRKNDGKAPSGIQSFMEPIFVFMRDEVTKPMIGEKHYERFQPFIMTIFFFILFCNLLGLVPIFPGSANITGNLAVTLTLALLAAIVAYVNGNKHYWEHTFWMPGVPWWVKLFILTPVEILGLIIKPFSLMVRLFANISAGHIIILSLISLIFIFGNNGQSTGGAIGGIIVGGAFTAFMNLLEILVAFLQAFIFAILTASYIGAAVEEPHHDHDGAHAHAH